MSTAVVTYAKPFERFFAYLIDLMILVMASSLIGGMLVVENAAGEPTIAPIGVLIMFLIKVLYSTAFISSKWQATPGQRMLNMHVIRLDGKKLSQRDALERYVALILPELPLYASFLPPLVAAMAFIWLTVLWFATMFTHPQRIAMHDKLCHTRVITGQARP